MSGNIGYDGARPCLGYHQLTSLGSVVGCPQASAGQAVVFKPEAQSIRYRSDGGTPSASVGMLVLAGECVQYVGDLTKLRFIQVAGGAILNVEVFG
jgi:hypothetical protein